MPQNTQTMRLGPLTATDESTNTRTVLHEFGHALGLFHETTNPAANINWDLPKTYQYYSTQFTKDEVDHFIINKESTSNYSEYDPLSIMHYYIPASITKDGKGVNEMNELSNIDKKSINEWYPFPIVSKIEPGRSLNALPWKDRIKSPNGRYSLEFVPGILRINDLIEKNVIWEVGNKFYIIKSSCFFDSNGNITLKGSSTPLAGSTKILWSNYINEYPEATLHLQDDGDLQLIYNGAVKWSSKKGKI